MDVLCSHGAGLDVQKKRVMACRITLDSTGQQADGVMALKGCGTMSVDWLALCDDEQIETRDSPGKGADALIGLIVV
jgi:hypothetical protein